MQAASIMLNIGGDSRNQVPKHNVTPSEVAVLRMIHGDDAISDIAIYKDEVKRSSKMERERLHETYAQVTPQGVKRCAPLDMLFPGVAARLYQSFDEMELDEHFFRAGHAPAREQADEEAEEMTSTSTPATGEPEGTDEDDIGDIDDGHAKDDVGAEGEQPTETGGENLFN